MRSTLPGKRGPPVSELCPGTMAFGDEWGWGSSRDDSRASVNAFAEAEGNFLDTADFLASESIQDAMFGGTQGLIDGS
jgi:aryl-alcohol dehydrogenase-like predicted oxidoreductase